jgi:quercetin dioxygenase-like cupin family protein
MRTFMLLAMAAALAGCGARAVHVVMPGADATVDELCRRYPIAPDADVRVERIARSDAASVHLVQVRGSETPHRHASHDLAVTMLHGEGLLHVAGATRAVRAGDTVFVPRGALHWFARGGADVAVTLAVFSPPLDAPDTVPVDDVDSSGDAR